MSLTMQIVGSGRELPLCLQCGMGELVGRIRLVESELGCSVFVSLGKVHSSGEVLSMTGAFQLRQLWAPLRNPESS